MASQTHPCYLLEIPAELHVSIYKHYFEATPLEVDNTALHHQAFRKVVHDCPQVEGQSNFIRTSRFIMREAHPIYTDVLNRQIGSLNTTVDMLGQKDESYHLRDPFLRKFFLR